MVGNDHPMAGRPFSRWPTCIVCKGSSTRRSRCCGGALAIHEKAFGAAHPDVAQVLASLSYIAIDRAQYR